MKTFRHALGARWALLFLFILVTGCATSYPRRGTPLWDAGQSLRQARAKTADKHERAGHYLDAAALAVESLARNAPTSPEHLRARLLYNESTAELASFLRRNGTLWSNRQHFPSHAGRGVYLLNLAYPPKRKAQGLWRPTLFTEFRRADKISTKNFTRRYVEEGYGGALVGVRDPRDLGQPRNRFAYKGSFSAPVTAMVNFRPINAQGITEATLSLYDPTARQTAPLGNKQVPLSADITAPIAYYPQRNEIIAGFFAMIQVEKYLTDTGLFMLQPYDPNKLPVIFVHGLASTPQMWMDIINDIEGDPSLRGRCQYWVVSYPSGVPLVYSAERLRQDLAAIEAAHPPHHGYLFIGHSMGGLVAKMQSLTTGLHLWDTYFNKDAEKMLARTPYHSFLRSSLIFDANPNVARQVFISTPHRGSKIADGRIGLLATRLIHLPFSIVGIFQDTVSNSLKIASGQRAEWPTAIQSLSPHSRTLSALNQLHVQAPFHTMMGNRNRPGPLIDSSDGIVPYTSSHLDGALSELVLPGNHSSYKLPQAIDEMKRIIHLQLDDTSSNKKKSKR